MKKRIVAMLLAGGQGSRLGVLTSSMAKPAVPFGGKYRIIDFKRDKAGIPAKVASIEYDPNRTARIALLHYVDGEKRYILAPEGLEVGAKVMSGPDAEIAVGNAIPLEKVPLGSFVHNVELKKGRGGQIARSAGTYGQVIAKDGDFSAVA